MRRGKMQPAQSVIPPQVSGYDPKLKSEMSDYDPQRAKALLDLAGYVDKDGDGGNADGLQRPGCGCDS